MSNYLPSRDADLEIWALNFSTLIAAAPTTYGLVAADATPFSIGVASGGAGNSG